MHTILPQPLALTKLIVNGAELAIVDQRLSVEPLQLVGTSATKIYFASGLVLDRLFPAEQAMPQVEPTFGNTLLPILIGNPTDQFWSKAVDAINSKSPMRLPENVSKLISLDLELARQRYIDQSKQEKNRILNEISVTESKLEAVSLWRKKLAECNAELSKIATTDISSEAILTLKQKVIERIRATMSGGRIASVVGKAKSYAQNLPVWPLIGLMLINFGYASFKALQVREMQLLFIGLLLLLVQGGLVVLFLNNRESSPLLELQENLLVEERSVLSSSEEKLFIDSALKRAYAKQREELEAAISMQLGQEGLSALESKISELKAELVSIDNVQQAQISPDDYLRKRRELDMLRLDLRRELGDLTEYGWASLINTLLPKFTATVSELNLGKFIHTWLEIDQSSASQLLPVIVSSDLLEPFSALTKTRQIITIKS